MLHETEAQHTSQQTVVLLEGHAVSYIIYITVGFRI